MDIEVYFGEGKKVNARIGRHIIKTDQRIDGGGEDSAPEPFDYFLSSLATCAGIYVKVFCERRGIDSSGIKLLQKHEVDHATHKISAINLEIFMPADFPEKYRMAVISAANQCTVKKVIADPPPINVSLSPAV
jgi:ribosomal protein S12 methylthiotransferase accessory factor